MDISTGNIWLIAGVIFLAAEALGMSGIGLLFAGLGALTVGAAVNMDLFAEGSALLQAVLFLAASALWAVALWKPIKKFRLNKNTGSYSNMVGETAYAGSNGISKADGGEATWSGTIMKATLAPDATVEALEAGAQVIIVDVKGATLIVKPKQH